MTKNKKGFTLMEILVAIAIVAILSSVVLVSMTAMRAKARAAKALAQLSSAIPSMISCWGNGYKVDSPTDNGSAICCQQVGLNCNSIASYGNYPDLSSGDLASFSYGRIDMAKGSWHFGAESATDDKAVCCNMTLNSCKEVDEPLGAGNCDDSVPSN